MSKFQLLDRYTRQDVEDALLRGDARELQHAVIAVALDYPDYAFANELCLRLARHADPTVRGNAILGFGHLARRFRKASDEARALVNSGVLDHDAHVTAQSKSALSDIEMFTSCPS